MRQSRDVARNSLLSQFLTQIHHHRAPHPRHDLPTPRTRGKRRRGTCQIIEAIQARDAERARRTATESMAIARRIRIAMLEQRPEDAATPE